jgi:hypothetical protein
MAIGSDRFFKQMRSFKERELLCVALFGLVQLANLLD